MQKCDNDIIKAIKTIYEEKQAAVYNPFSRGSNENNSQSSVDSNNMVTGTSSWPRRRKINEMSCDSPQSDKVQANDDEEDKDPQQSAKDDKAADGYCTYLINSLKRVQNENDASAIIKNALKAFKQETSNENSSLGSNTKSKISAKEKRMFADFVRKLSSDNDILKKGLQIMTKKEQQNLAKISRFDDLAEAYNKQTQEIERLKRENAILKYNSSKNKCIDNSYYNGFGNNGMGNGDVF
jgi:hypothetical protein